MKLEEDPIIPSNTFSCVRFILLGFDPISQLNVGSKLVNGGGVDVFHYGPACTHVIVHNIVYDDPICVAARRDGKVLVTELWVNDSFDAGTAVDPNSVMYRPLIGRDGIPGAKTLLVCLTGYQRQDRNDIMTMVRLMGANFLKPLVANKVTHLICYKFEGEKYELAKKMERIKLVNHRWLEDCLKAWKLLPEADYDKSGYELEMMEAEAKDSEEEDAGQDPDIKQSEETKTVGTPKPITIRASISPKSKENLSNTLQTSSASKGFPNVSSCDVTVSASREDMATKVVGYKDPLDLQGVTYDQSYARTLTSDKVGNSLDADSDGAKSISKNYSGNFVSREIRSLSSLSKLDPGKPNTTVGFDKSLKVDVDKFKTIDGFESFGNSLLREQSTARTEIGPGRSPPNERATSLYGKRKMDISEGISKLLKVNCGSPDLNLGTPSVSNAGLDKNASPINRANAPSGSRHTPPINLAKEIKYDFDPKPMSIYVSTLNEPQPSSSELVSIGSAIGHGTDNIMKKPDNETIETVNPERQQKDAQVPSPKNKMLVLDKSSSPSSDNTKGKHVESLGKPARKKTIAKRTWNLGSRPKVALRKAKNKKGSINLNDEFEKGEKMISNVNLNKTMVTEMNNVEPLEKVHVDKIGDMYDETEAPEDKEEDEINAVVGGEKAEQTHKVTEMNNVEPLEKEHVDKIGDMYDETEAPEDKEEDEINAVVGGEKAEKTHKVAKANDKVEGERKMELNHSADEGGAEFGSEINFEENGIDEPTIDNVCDLEKPTKSLGKRKSVLSVSAKRKLKEISREESENKDKNHNQIMGQINQKNSSSPRSRAEETPSLGKEDTLMMEGKEKEPAVNRNSALLVSGKIKSKNGASKEESEKKKNNYKIKRVPSLKESNGSAEVEKENRPNGFSDPNIGQRIANAASYFKKTPTKIGSKAGATNDSILRAPNLKSEPTMFLLTGHKLQRREFQQVIKRLKGRVCRDSHKWSYQATHFINPDPLRRTEKFFAAAASGRWILKTDYLAACDQAGKFLGEEHFEWHKKCLSEDGAINLEAPRKWRLLRERTGHGALYGMHVIVYGECIAPPLETLKRVIKAGDGTILATSPPYTKFLNSGIDYAIVSSGMPRVDTWVQEFLKNEIPCIVADYMVEYICKPGYPLDKHVLYNTQAWAQKSFARLQNLSEEVVLEKETPENDLSNDDIRCMICGSSERGEVMLICGDESGSFGCGVGTHIDCCNPPIDSVPDEDWFCSKCSESKKSKGHSKSTKKKKSSSKAR